MAYFKIGDKDFSNYVRELTIQKKHNYNAQTNAAGDTVVDYISAKRVVEVGIITVNEAVAKEILDAVDGFNVLISFRDPRNGALVEGMNCVIPETEIDYYTIQTDKVLVNEFELEFTEL